jgi:DNA modification methylase
VTNLPGARIEALPPIIRLATEQPSIEELTEFESGECYPIALPRLFIEAASQPGELVFDPFAGSGTTLVAAQQLGRRGLGLEIHPERVEWCAARLRDPASIRHADALRLAELNLPPVDLVLTSPPYMTIRDHPENPLTGYQTRDGDYHRYLQQLAGIFIAAGNLLRPGGWLVLNAANMRTDGHVTPLAWDLAAMISGPVTFVRELVIDWDEPADWMTNDYCLLFRRPQ